MSNTAFIDDMSVSRTYARQCMIRCSQIGDEQGLRSKLVKVLNEALATQLICVLRCRAYDYSCHLFPPNHAAGKFVDIGQRERGKTAQEHADRLANRIVQLGGHADLSPLCLARRDCRDYINAGNLPDLWREDLIASRITVDIYREMIRYVGERDLETRQLLEDILAEEKHQADALAAKIASLTNQEHACSTAVAV
jgi:bacterioferritin